MSIEANFGCISFDNEYVISKRQLCRAISVAIQAGLITFADIEQVKDVATRPGAELYVPPSTTKAESDDRH